jgi:hypothetical protein
MDIAKVCFAPGLEVCLIETSGGVRIFSLATQQFRHVFFRILVRNKTLVMLILIVLPGAHTCKLTVLLSTHFQPLAARAY